MGPQPSSQPLDLDDLNARLRQVSSGGNPTASRARPQSPEQLRHPSPNTYHRIESKEFETIYHNQLVSDGGRPLYPIGMIDQVLERPEAHRELLQPLQKLPGANAPFDIFDDQLKRWKNFRKWQKDNRGLEDENDTYEAYVREIMFWEELTNLDWAQAEFMAKMEANPLHLEPEWMMQQRVRNRERLWWRERDCNGFADYFEAVKRRLADHGFIRSFELEEDPTQQDKLTTWIEYLGFESWWFDKHIGDIDRLAPEHDKAWKELVDSKIVGPHDTPESVRSDQTALQREIEIRQAQAEVHMAKEEAASVYEFTQVSPHRRLMSEKRRIEMLNKATKDVEDAERRKREIKARHDRVRDFIRGTFKYVDAQRKLACHGLYVQWVLEQIPLVEAEMAQAEAERSRASQSMGKKRVLSPQEDLNAGPSQKRQRTMQGSLPLADGNSAEGTVQAQKKAQSSRPIKAARKRSCRSADASSLPPVGFRRSARIAARQPPAQPEPRQLRPRQAKKSAEKSIKGAKPRTSAKGKSVSRGEKKGLGTKKTSKASRR